MLQKIRTYVFKMALTLAEISDDSGSTTWHIHAHMCTRVCTHTDMSHWLLLTAGTQEPGRD